MNFLSALPIRLILFQGGGALGRPSSTQGLHLAGGRKDGRVLAGYVTDLAVSPDGCRVAAIHSESIRAQRDARATLKLLDLCKKDGN